MKKHIFNHSVLVFIFAVILWAALSQFSFNIFPQTRQEPLRYEVEVILVEIPLYVVDKKGNPVLDLKPEDVTIYENGKRQKTTHFVLVQNDSPQIASIVREYPAARRQFLLFFDFAFATPAKIVKARQASLNFIKEKILPNDLVAVVTYSAIGGLRILSHFTNDREHLFSIVNTLGLVELGQRTYGPLGFTFPDFMQISTDPMLLDASGLSDGELEFMKALERAKEKTEDIYSAHVSDFVGEFEKLSKALSSIRGRKHIIYFSEGFDSRVITGKSLDELSKDVDEFIEQRGVPTSDKDSRFGDTGLRMKLYDALKLIASSDCPIHTIDIGGIRTQAGTVTKFEGAATDLTSIRRGQDTLTVLSRETGGQVYKNVNRLDEPLENLLQITNTYYILGYYPKDKKKEGKYRKIKIKTDRRDIKISYRKGYYEAKPYKEYSNLEKRLQLIEYIVKDIARSEIPFDSFVSAFRGREGICRVPVFLKFPGSQFREKKKRIKFEIYGYAISSAGVFRDFFHQTLEISPNQAKLDQGLKYFDLHLVHPGDYKIRLIVRDADTGEIGSQFQEISVPDYDNGELGLSGPVFIQPESGWLLTRGYDPKKPTGRKVGVNLPLDYPYILDNKPFIPGVVPYFYGSSPVQFYVRVYNLKVHPVTKVPQTEMNFEIVDAEGNSTPLRNVGLVKNPTQLEPGVFDILFQANLGYLSSGYYQLKLSFKDIMSNQMAVSKTPFIFQ
jgi:VWFA-related protein